jgi:hypothetical protein
MCTTETHVAGARCEIYLSLPLTQIHDFRTTTPSRREQTSCHTAAAVTERNGRVADVSSTLHCHLTLQSCHDNDAFPGVAMNMETGWSDVYFTRLYI